MSPTDYLFQYLNETRHEALETDEAYQTAEAARNEAEKALVFSMTRRQRQMFHSYKEQSSYVDALGFCRLCSRGSLQFTLTPPPRTTRE